MSNNEFEAKFEQHTGIKFVDFYKSQKVKLRWHLSHFTKDEVTAEDFAEEAFIQCLNKIHTFNSEKSQIHTWLYTIAENIVKKDYKDRQRLPAVLLDKEYATNLTLSNFVQYSDGRKELEKQKEVDKKAEIVRDAIYSLPEKYKNVLVMRELENMSYNDIAELLSINLSTIKSQILHGRKMVRKKVARKFSYIDHNGLSDYKRPIIGAIRRFGLRHCYKD